MSGQIETKPSHRRVQWRALRPRTDTCVVSRSAPPVLTIRHNGSQQSFAPGHEVVVGRDLYADLEKRIAALETGVHAGGEPGVAAGAPATGAAGAATAVEAGVATKAGPAAASGAEPTTPVDDQAAYGRAFEQLKSGDYRTAITQFQAFMKNYPQSALLDNAQYWIGEAYYVTRDYDLAAKAFKSVGERWPASRKAPDALLKLGYTQYEQKHLSEARTTLNDVVQRFPGTDAARLASERLQKLPAEAR